MSAPEATGSSDAAADSRRTVTILVPVFNEQDVLDQFYGVLDGVLAGLPAYAFEILFVDDGSDDATPDRVVALAGADPRISLIRLSRNFGKESAMLAGLDAVTTDAVILIDVDLQDPPGLIAEMLAAWEEGYDDVYARRRSRAGETMLKRTTSRSEISASMQRRSRSLKSPVSDWILMRVVRCSRR